jgi:hypothetical protein
MIEPEVSNRQPRTINPRLDPDTKRPLTDRNRGGWLLPGIITAIVVAGIAIFAFGNNTPTATSPMPDTTAGHSKPTPTKSAPETAPRE